MYDGQFFANRCQFPGGRVLLLVLSLSNVAPKEQLRWKWLRDTQPLPDDVSKKV